MPMVTGKDGKKRHFSYSKSGFKAAKDYASKTGGKFSMGNMKSKMAKKKSYGA